MNFSIVTVRVPDPTIDRHHRALDDVRAMLWDGLRLLGHEVHESDYVIDTGEEWCKEPCIPIALNGGLLGYKRAPGTVIPQVPYSAIFYNWENLLSPLVQEMVPLYMTRRVWEAFPSHVRPWALTLGTVAQPVPFAWYPSLENGPAMLDERERDIDVLFYGSMSEYRRTVLAGLHRAGLRVFVHTADDPCYALALREKIIRSKIVLNMKYQADYETPVLRAQAAMARGAFVVSEPGADLRGPGIMITEYERLVDECVWWLGRPKEREAVVFVGREHFRNTKAEDVLRPAIEESHLT